MNNFMEVIKGRRSIRRYQDRGIPEDLLDHVLEAVQWSPSWANTQCWEVVVVKDSQIKRGIQEKMGKANPATKAIVEAPIVLGICGKLCSSGYYKDEATTKFGDWFMFDLGLATPQTAAKPGCRPFQRLCLREFRKERLHRRSIKL